MKNLNFIICVLLGAAIGYFIPHHKGADFTDDHPDTTTINKIATNKAVVRKILSTYNYTFTPPETAISKQEAMDLIAQFKKQNSDDINDGGGMLGRGPADGSATEELGGFVISRASIDSIYKNDGSQTCTGLRIYLAKRPGSAPKARLFTFIVVGTKKAGTKATGNDIEGPIIEHVDPCPQNCGQLHP